MARRNGSRIDIHPDERHTFTESCPGGAQEPTVTTRRIEHASDRARHGGHRTIEQPIDQGLRRVERAELATGVTFAGLRGTHTLCLQSPVVEFSRYLEFTRDEWADLRAATPLTIRERDLEALRGLEVELSIDEVVDIYLPLTRLLNLYVSATQNLHKVSSTFLGTIAPKVPYIIGIAGSVAVGKSTFARVLGALLSRWPDHPKVDLVTTDGFLLPNAVLTERDILNRKGFPESYDTRRLLQFLREVKSGAAEVRAPVYSHVVYDIVESEEVVVQRPDILILEGINVLQVPRTGTDFVSDYFDFSIYVDADEANIERWYVQRFLALREAVFSNPSSYFRHFAHLSDEQAVATAQGIWHEINGLNLRENILPTREPCLAGAATWSRPRRDPRAAQKAVASPRTRPGTSAKLSVVGTEPSW